jgi:hypothetical protein
MMAAANGDEPEKSSKFVPTFFPVQLAQWTGTLDD